jgi:hypothetical protein
MPCPALINNLNYIMLRVNWCIKLYMFHPIVFIWALFSTMKGKKSVAIVPVQFVFTMATTLVQVQLLCQTHVILVRMPFSWIMDSVSLRAGASRYETLKWSQFHVWYQEKYVFVTYQNLIDQQTVVHSLDVFFINQQKFEHTTIKILLNDRILNIQLSKFCWTIKFWIENGQNFVER